MRVGFASDEQGVMHMIHGTARAGIALCGCMVSVHSLPLSNWGLETEHQSRWCAMCSAEAIELLDGSAARPSES